MTWLTTKTPTETNIQISIPAKPTAFSQTNGSGHGLHASSSGNGSAFGPSGSSVEWPLNTHCASNESSGCGCSKSDTSTAEKAAATLLDQSNIGLG